MSSTKQPRIFPARRDSNGALSIVGPALGTRQSTLVMRALDHSDGFRSWVDTPSGMSMCDVYIGSGESTGWAVAVDDAHPQSRSSGAAERALERRAREAVLQACLHAEAPSADAAISVMTQFVEPPLVSERLGHQRLNYWSALRAGRVLLLGGAGAGKTTSLRHFACSLALDDESESATLPAYVPLRRFAQWQSGGALDTERILEQCWASDRQAVRRLQSAWGVTYILDGLDEMPLAMQSHAVSWIRRLEYEFPESRFVIACRTESYRGWFDDHHKVVLSGWSAPQIAQYVSKFLSGGDQVHYPRVIDQCFSHPETLEACANPLFLNMAVRDCVRDGARIDPASSLTYRWTDALLETWDRTRAIQRRDDPRSHFRDRAMMRRLGLLAVQSDSGSFDDGDALAEEVVGGSVGAIPLSRLAHASGLLAEDGPGRYRFSSSLHAYALAAEWLVMNQHHLESNWSGGIELSRVHQVLLASTRLTGEPDGLILELLRLSGSSTEWAAAELLLALFVEPILVSDVAQRDAARLVESVLLSLFSGATELAGMPSGTRYGLVPELAPQDLRDRPQRYFLLSVRADLREYVGRVVSRLPGLPNGAFRETLVSADGAPSERSAEAKYLVDLLIEAESVVVAQAQNDGGQGAIILFVQDRDPAT